MTLTATADHHSLQAAARTPDVPVAPASTTASTLSDAVRAVTDHRREVELRRMAHAARQSQASSDWMVPVPRARLQALEQQAREAAVLRRRLGSVLMQLPQTSDAQAPLAERPERHLAASTKQRPRLDARRAPST
jgi:hypothetical protein